MKLKLPCLLIMVLSVVTYAKIPTTNSSHQLLTNITFDNASVKSSTDYSDYIGKISRFDLNESLPIDNSSFRMDQYTVTNPIQRIRLRFSAEDGLRRPLLLAFTPDNAATDGFDYGYDALSTDEYPNDMFWNIDGVNYIIQGVGAFDESKAYPLDINITNAGSIHIELTDLENFNSEIDVFVYDSLLDTYTQINSNDFEIVLESAIYQNRFFLAFSSNDAQTTTDDNALSIADNDEASIQVSYLIGSREIYLKSTELMDVKKVHLLNLIGQTIMTRDKQEFNSTGGELRIPVENIPEGTYIIKVETKNSTINKKAIIKY